MATRITDKDVWRAADEVLQAGERPTIERIRHRLGRGSPNTVNEHLNTWYAQLSSRIRDLETFTPASSIPEPVGQAARHFWEVAQSLAREETLNAMALEQDALDAREREVSERSTDLENREHGYRAQIATLEASLTLVQREREGLRTKCEEREAALNDREGQLQAARRLELELREQLGAAEVTLADERRVAEARQRLSDERLDKTETRAAAEIDRAREESKQLGIELKAASVALEKERSQAAIAQKHLGDAESKLHAATLELQRNRDAYDGLLTQLSAQKGSNEALLSALGEAQNLLKLKDEEHGALLKSLVAHASGPKRKAAKSAAA